MALFATLFEYSESELRERGQALMRALEAQPSLVIHRAPSPDYDALLHSHAPSAELAVISGGHWIHIEHPDAFAERLHTFIESL
jgi:pimeloyl-ACP methyl ester carboxylesterase